jgi:methylthioribose-1-phosphate isomerase
MTADVRPIEWNNDHLVLLDQTQLPLVETYLTISTVAQLNDAIMRLVVRGAPALGAVGGYGVALAMIEGKRENWDAARLTSEIDSIRNARPTAVNLAWGVNRVEPYVAQGFDAVLNEAHAIAREDAQANRAMGRLGADWIEQHVERRPLRLLTHCNTGTLATTEWGTALGVIRELHARGKVEIVYADETRPLLQGARLTAWELQRNGIPHLVQADGAAASTILRGMVDVALIGADRIAANGDSANKIGSVGVALACKEAGIPFLVVAPVSTVDLDTADGADIHIELRSGDEVTTLAGVRTAPLESEGFNPAFDVTPAHLITAIVTETTVIEMTKGQTPKSVL